MSQVRYDPKMPTKEQLAEIRRQEQQDIASSRRRLSDTTSRRRLLALSSALRTDLEIFVNHLLDFGSVSSALLSGNDADENVCSTSWMSIAVAR